MVATTYVPMNKPITKPINFGKDESVARVRGKSSFLRGLELAIRPDLRTLFFDCLFQKGLIVDLVVESFGGRWYVLGGRWLILWMLGHEAKSVHPFTFCLAEFFFWSI